jgi:hypothetical protein
MSWVPDIHKKPPEKLLKNIHLLRCASPFVIAAYVKIRLTPHGLHALHLTIFEQLSKFLLFSW